MLKENLPLISVIVPCYNAENFIDKCLQSLCKQSYKNLEIIAVDDFSTDDTFKILSFYAKKDSRIIPLKSKNKGVSCARNTGIDIAKGKFITFMDSDDFVSPFHIELLATELISSGADVSIIQYKRARENAKYNPNKFIKPQNYKTEKFDKLGALKEYLCQNKFEFCAWNKLYSGEILRKNNIRFEEDCHYNEDSLFNYKFFKQANKTVLVKTPTYYYVQRSNSLVHQPFSEYKLSAFISLNNIIKDAYNDFPAIIHHAHVMRLAICCELIYYIKFFKFNGGTFNNGAIIRKILHYLAVDVKHLKFCREPKLYRKILIPLMPPVFNALLCKRKKLDGNLPTQFSITDK